MVEQKVIWTCECGFEALLDLGIHPVPSKIRICTKRMKPVVYYRKDEQVERVKKSVFIEHLTEEQQKELWEALYG